MLKNILSLILSVLICLFVTGCADESANTQGQSNTNKPSISVSTGQSPKYQMNVGDTETVCFKISSSSPVFKSDIILNISDSDIIRAEFSEISSGYVYYKITAKKQGVATFSINIPRLNVTSSSIEFNVNDSLGLGISASLGHAPKVSLVKGKNMLVCFKINGGFSEEDVQIVIGDESIASADYEKQENSYFYYKITGLEKGETTLYAYISHLGIKSEEITVTVSASSSLPEGTDETDAAFVCSKNSDTFHTVNCSHANQIHEENKLFFTAEQREELINSGKEPCKSCNP